MDNLQSKRLMLRLKKKPAVKKRISIPPSIEAAKALSGLLAQHSEAWREYRPLRVGVIEEVYDLLQKEEQTFSKNVVHKCLRWHTHQRRYVLGLVTGALRFSLDGEAVGAVSEEEAALALKKI